MYYDSAGITAILIHELKESLTLRVIGHLSKHLDLEVAVFDQPSTSYGLICALTTKCLEDLVTSCDSFSNKR